MKHKKILACFLTFSFLLTGCSTKDQSQSLSMTGTYFDTVVKIEVWGADSKIMDGCKDICEKYEQLLSPTIDSSEISQINQAQGASVSVSKETADLIELGKYYGDLSDGNLISQSLLPVIFGISMIMRIIASLTQSSCPKQLLISIIKLLRSTEQR